jgi:drug/metabolite transporter superfamily protein YnfA
MRTHGRTQFRWIDSLKTDTSKAQYSAAKGRRFALTLAAAFAVLGTIAYLRHRHATSVVFAALAGVFLAAAIIIPSRLEPVERAWMGLAHAMSRITTPIFMSIVYFVVLTPIGLIRRLAGNPLVHKPVAGSYWVERQQSDRVAARRRMERQF